MRVAHLPSSYLPDALGGTEMYVRRLIESLTPIGVESCVVTHGERKTDAKDPDELVRLPRLQAVNRRQLYARSGDTSPIGFESFLDSWKPDVVHFHALTLGAGVDHARCLKRRGIPYVVTYHTPAQSCPRGTMLLYGKTACDGRLEAGRCACCVLQGRGQSPTLAKALSKLPFQRFIPEGPWLSLLAASDLIQRSRSNWFEFFQGANWIVACAQFCKDALVINGIDGQRIYVIRQALPGATRNRTLRKVRNTNQLRIGYFGRVTHVKGVDIACEAIDRLNQSGRQAKLEIVGPVPTDERKWLERSMENRQCQYLGILQGNALREWLQVLDLVVIPSRWLETGPLTLLEAWDVGTPVIGSDMAGIRDFMAANGLQSMLFEMGNADALVAAVDRLLARGSDQVEIPGIDTLAARYRELYRNAVDTALATVSQPNSEPITKY